MELTNQKCARQVVIFDDEPAFPTLLTKMVSDLGYEVTVSSDPRSSRTFELRDSDIVFIDVLTPDGSGPQVLEQLARQNVKSAIVLMSGLGEYLDEAEKLAEQLELNLIGVLEKPFCLADIKDVLAGRLPLPLQS